MITQSITTTLLRLALIGALAIGASAVATTSASATTEPVFAFCHDFGVGNGHGAYEDAHCEKLKLGGEYGVAYADTSKSLLLCLWELKPKFLFTEDHCAADSSTNVGEFAKQLITTAGTPLFLGAAINDAVVQGKLAGAKVEISCRNVKFETQPEEGGKSSNGRGEYSECQVVGSTKCILTEPVVTSFTDRLEGGKLDVFTGALSVGSESEIFTEIQFLNKTPETCSLNGQSFRIKGLQACEGVIPGGGHFKLVQELECLPEGSKMTLGPEPVTYENQASITVQNGEAFTVLLVEP